MRRHPHLGDAHQHDPLHRCAAPPHLPRGRTHTRLHHRARATAHRPPRSRLHHAKPHTPPPKPPRGSRPVAVRVRRHLPARPRHPAQPRPLNAAAKTQTRAGATIPAHAPIRPRPTPRHHHRQTPHHPLHPWRATTRQHRHSPRQPIPRLRKPPVRAHRPRHRTTRPHPPRRNPRRRTVHPPPRRIRPRLHPRNHPPTRPPRRPPRRQILPRPARPPRPLHRRLHRPRIPRASHPR